MAPCPARSAKGAIPTPSGGSGVKGAQRRRRRAPLMPLPAGGTLDKPRAGSFQSVTATRDVPRWTEPSAARRRSTECPVLAPCSLLFAPCSLRPALCSLLFSLFSLRPALCSLLFSLCALPFALCALLARRNKGPPQASLAPSLERDAPAGSWLDLRRLVRAPSPLTTRSPTAPRRASGAS